MTPWRESRTCSTVESRFSFVLCDDWLYLKYGIMFLRARNKFVDKLIILWLFLEFHEDERVSVPVTTGMVWEHLLLLYTKLLIEAFPFLDLFTCWKVHAYGSQSQVIALAGQSVLGHTNSQYFLILYTALVLFSPSMGLCDCHETHFELL